MITRAEKERGLELADKGRMTLERLNKDLAAFRIQREDGGIDLGMFDRMDRKVTKLRDALSRLQYFTLNLDGWLRDEPKPPAQPPTPPKPKGNSRERPLRSAARLVAVDADGAHSNSDGSPAA